jgi:vesicle coat complex subunit
VPHQLDSSTAHKLLAALPECNEWGQVTILDSIANYKPESADQAEKIVERVRPRLQHANSAVVLSASKVNVHVNVHKCVSRKMYFIVLFGGKVALQHSPPQCKNGNRRPMNRFQHP